MKKYDIRVDREQVLSWISGGKAQSAASGDEQLLKQMDSAVLQIESAGTARYVYNIFEIERSSSLPQKGTSHGKTEINDSCSSRNNESSGIISKDRNYSAEVTKHDKNADKPYHNENGSDKSCKDGILLKGSSLALPGRDIATLFAECSHCILLAVSIGAAVDRILRRAQVLNMADAVILDFCASSAVEDLCGRINSDLENEYEAKDLYLTDRFSPGYGDLPVDLQREICRVLQTDKRLGLTASASNMLIPSKSITAIIGISNRPQPKRISGCGSCKMVKNCSFRKAGTTCE